MSLASLPSRRRNDASFSCRLGLKDPLALLFDTSRVDFVADDLPHA